MAIGITAMNLRKEFGEVVALDSVSFEVPRGSIVGLLGPNGAGKSSLVRLLSGINRPTSGSAAIYGHDLENEKEQVKRITGLLPEEYALYDKLSVREYIFFIGSLYDLNTSQINERFIELAGRLDLIDIQYRLIETLSKGMKQKVAIIASIIHDPKVLFLDEPMANLDVHSQRIVHQIITEYQSASRVILIATHLLSSIENNCDIIAIINKGVINYVGPVGEFCNGQSLENAYLKYMGENH